MTVSIKDVALRTTDLEARSVAGLTAFVNDDFEKGINAISDCSDRVVMSGIRKSDVITQKIAATLNSTGTPSIFMHAADATLGDLGMVQQDDVVIIISKSGESPSNERPKVFRTQSLKEVIVEMTQKRVGVTAGVDDKDHLLGIMTDGDLRRMQTSGIQIDCVRAADIMTKKPKTIGPGELAIEAPSILRKKPDMTVNSNRRGILPGCYTFT